MYVRDFYCANAIGSEFGYSQALHIFKGRINLGFFKNAFNFACGYNLLYPSFFEPLNLVVQVNVDPGRNQEYEA